MRPNAPNAPTDPSHGKTTDAADANAAGGKGRSPDGDRDPAARPNPAGAGGQPEYWRVVHRALRGRYVGAAVLALVGAAVGGAAGWKFTRPQYRSEGLIHIAYNRTSPFPDADPNGPIAAFDTLMQSQQMLITSQRMVEAAMRDPAWQATGRGITAESARHFANNLVVEVKPKTEYVRVSFTDIDPVVAAAAVRSVVNTYEQMYAAEREKVDQQRLGLVVQRRQAVAARSEDLRAKTDAAAAGFGSTNIDSLHEATVQRFNRLKSMLDDARVGAGTTTAATAATTATAAPTGGLPTTRPAAGAWPSAGALAAVQPAPAGTALTAEQIAAADSIMKEYWDNQVRLDDQLQQLTLQFGSSHDQVIRVRQSLERAVERVNRYADEYRTLQALNAAAAAAAATRGAAGPGVRTADAVRADEAKVAGLCEEARRDMVAIGNRRMELQRLQADAGAASKELDDVTRQEDNLRAVSALGGRMTVLSRGEVPLAPDKDYRLKVGGLAAACAACLPVGLLVLAALVRRRYRYSDEAEADVAGETRQARLLGILPTLSAAAAADQRAAAAHCVHQARVLLQSEPAAGRCRTYLVTSASAGEGKTSLAVSLGLSFAASGCRTLLVDCDLVGQRLTRDMRAAAAAGLHEAAAAGSMRGCLTRAAGRLWVLPVGRADPLEGCALSAAAFRKLLDQARRNFDVVIVDSGPVLGSVEAALVAPQVDGVVFAIARGQQQPLVRRSFRQLEQLGATVIGSVFNRARSADFYQSAYSSSSHRSLPAEPAHRPDGWRASSSRGLAAAGPDRAERGERGERFGRFGALVQAVVGSLPSAYEASLS